MLWIGNLIDDTEFGDIVNSLHKMTNDTETSCFYYLTQVDFNKFRAGLVSNDPPDK